MRADWDIEERALQHDLMDFEHYARLIQGEFDRVSGLLRFESLEDYEQDELVKRAKNITVRKAVREFLLR